MINVQKVKKGLGKCWKFFAAKPAYASLTSTWQCRYCGQTMWQLTSFRPDPNTAGPCKVTGMGHGWVRIK